MANLMKEITEATALASARHQCLKRVVIESPCAGNTKSTYDEHSDYVRRAVTDSILNYEEAPIASHLLFAFSNLLDDANAEERALGMAAGHAWILSAQALVVYRDYGISPGMDAAIAIATLNGIPVHYRLIGRNDNPST